MYKYKKGQKIKVDSKDYPDLNGVYTVDIDSNGPVHVESKDGKFLSIEIEAIAEVIDPEEEE